MILVIIDVNICCTLEISGAFYVKQKKKHNYVKQNVNPGLINYGLILWQVDTSKVPQQWNSLL